MKDVVLVKFVRGHYEVRNWKTRALIGEVRKKYRGGWEWGPAQSVWAMETFPTREKAVEELVRHVRSEVLLLLPD